MSVPFYSWRSGVKCGQILQNVVNQVQKGLIGPTSAQPEQEGPNGRNAAKHGQPRTIGVKQGQAKPNVVIILGLVGDHPQDGR